MARLFMLAILTLAVVLLAGLAVSATVRAARDAGSAGRGIVATTGGTNMQKIAYAALFILMLGVTSGLLGGL
ncbi:MAG: hypothetical protein ACE369_10715 [Roseovarius sp.]